jgi:hypothetical protein
VANAPATHVLTEQAPDSEARWTHVWTLDALRYRGSGWWLDAALPRSPLGLLAAAIVLPVAWFAAGFALTDDRAAFLSTHDCTCQLWFFPLHLVCVRIAGGLWAGGLGAALHGLALDRAARFRIRRGALGTWANIGGLVACAYFVFRDITFGLTPGANGLIPFDDPDLWGFAALGRSVHVLMLVLWCIEWVLFGYLLWLQIWTLAAWVRELRRADFRPHLADVLVGDGYRHAFTLFGKTATVCLVFAVGNLAFIYFTGELIPRDSVRIASVGDFLRQMSDLLSTTLLFVLILAAIYVFATTLKKKMTRAVNELFAEAGDVALAEMAQPLALAGDAAVDVERLRVRVEAQSGLLRAAIFQREVDALGTRTIAAIIVKSLVPLVTAALKIKKLFGA